MDDKEQVKGCHTGCDSCEGCGHDHEEMEMVDGFSPVLTLTDEDGKDMDFEILDVVVMDDEKEYLVVTEADSKEEEDLEVVILEIKEENGEEVYDTVTDENVAEEVFKKFQEQQEAYEDEAEEDEE